MDDYVKKYENNSLFNKAYKMSDFNDDNKEYYNATRFKDIAVVRMFKEKIWESFSEVCGRKVGKSVRNKSKKTMMENGFNYVNYYIQYIDILNDKYLDVNKEKRKTLLARLTRKIITKGDDYYDIAFDIDKYCKKNNLPIEEVRLNIEFPEEIVW